MRTHTLRDALSRCDLHLDEAEIDHLTPAVEDLLRQAWADGYQTGAWDEREDMGGKRRTANPFPRR